MTLRFLAFLIFFFSFSWGLAQQRYYVFFSDKPQIKFEAETYFHPKALERRVKNSLPLWDELDLPLNQQYVSQVSSNVDSVRHQLRWLNAMTVSAFPWQIEGVKKFAFVDSIVPFDGKIVVSSYPDQLNKRYDTLLSLTRNQMNLDVLVDSGLVGKGVRVAILDAGFKHADIHPSLTHIRQEKRIVATRDFYDGDNNVYHHSLHGMQVMSCVGGKYQERNLGAAPAAEFLLARIESERSEKAIEEDNWIAAAEWADQMGAEIINSSVTYTYQRYSYADMNGKTAPVSIGAAIAVKKGMHVVCSMGNEGESKWTYMGAPADVPGVISVGGSLSMIPMHIKFASIGPTFTNHLKPDIAAPGFVLSAIKKNKFGENAGTSFSAPLISGFLAAMIERYPDKSQTEIRELLKQSGHFYPYFDYYLGYGVPKAEKIFGGTDSALSPTFEVLMRSDSVILKFDTTYMHTDSLTYPDGRPLYYHLEGEDGKLSAYLQLRIPHKTQYYYFRRNMQAKGILRIWFGGDLYEEKF